MLASEGPAVDAEVAQSAPIINYNAPEPVPAFTSHVVPGLPPEAQPAPGDVLLSRAFWPWTDLGAEGIPEHWLYMARRVQGVIAQLAVQTSAGPKLVRADKTGRISAGTYYDRNPKTVQIAWVHFSPGHASVIRSSYQVPSSRLAILEMAFAQVDRTIAAAPAGRSSALIEVTAGGQTSTMSAVINDNTVGSRDHIAFSQAGFLNAGDSVDIADEDLSTGGECYVSMTMRLTEFDA